MKANEEAYLITYANYSYIEIYNKVTKKLVSKYGAFKSVYHAETFATEHHIEIWSRDHC